MNAPLTATALQQTTSIANRAMKFRLSRGGLKKRVRDADAEAFVKQNLGDEGQIVSRELFKDKNSPVYQYQQIANEMYSFHVKATLPFGDDGWRLLPNAQYFDYTTQMNIFLSKLGTIKQSIVSNWDALVQQDVLTRNNALAAQGKQSSARVSDYPTAKQMEERLYVTWYPEPISTAGDFRFDLPQDMLDRLDSQINEMVEAAGKDLYVRMLKPVAAFVEKLNEYKGEKGQRMHTSFVDNLNALSKEIPRLNINDDPAVTAMLQQIDAIIKPYAFAPEILKDSDTARESVRTKLAALEEQLKGYTL